MKIYIGPKNLEDKSYKCISDVSILEYVSEDSECNLIVLDGVFRKNNIDKYSEIVQLVCKKLRINGTLIVVDIDFDLLAYAYSKIGNIQELNKSVFTTDIQSFLTYDILLNIFQSVSNVSLVKSSMQNIEFNMEFVKK